MNSQRSTAVSSIWHSTKLILAGSVLLISLSSSAQDGSWKAPESADKLENPVSYDRNVKNEAKTLYTEHCLICHGKKGDGKGVAAMNDPDPADLRSDYVQKQTDGAIFWKITEGHDRMIAYKGVLTEQQRWILVSYIREL